METREDFFKFPTRALLIFSLFSSLIIGLFSASVLLSVAQITWKTEPPIFTIDGVNYVISMPLKISNNGFHSIFSLQINTFVQNGNNTILNATSYFPQIKPKENVTFYHNLTINLEKVLAANTSYLFNNTEFMAVEEISLNLAKLIPVTLVANHTIPWGAPLSEFHTSHFEYSTFNETHTMLNFKIEFKNQSPFSVNGTLTLVAYHDTQQLYTTTGTVNAPSGNPVEVGITMILPYEKLCNKVTMAIQTELFEWEGIIYD